MIVISLLVPCISFVNFACCEISNFSSYLQVNLLKMRPMRSTLERFRKSSACVLFCNKSMLLSCFCWAQSSEIYKGETFDLNLIYKKNCRLQFQSTLSCDGMVLQSCFDTLQSIFNARCTFCIMVSLVDNTKVIHVRIKMPDFAFWQILGIEHKRKFVFSLWSFICASSLAEFICEGFVCQ